MLFQNANGSRSPKEPEGNSPERQQTKGPEEPRGPDECSRALHILDSAPAPGWTAHVTTDGRLYYCNHITRTAGWLPPADAWKTATETLPYGWERAVDDTGRSYYINHVNKTTTYETPVYGVTENLPKPKPRLVTLERSASLGFGFVAGSEKPVIVRFVTEGGPSVDKLLPGDQILTVNGEDVKSAPREHVISLVRSCTHSVSLEVCQPTEQQGVRKSTLLSATKRARLKSKPSRVRFAESVCVNGAPLFPPSAFSLGDVCVPQMANVLKVFLENGQTKSFKYDTWTTVQDVINSLQAKLCIKASEYFSLVVEHIKSLKRNKLTLLDPQDSIARIASQPGAHKLRCLFRVTFVPLTAASLAEKDLNGLDYLFNQCCNDVIQERFSPELQYDTALRLAALHMYHHALANNMQANKLTVKIVEKEFGLDRFIPASVLDHLKTKEIRKILGHFLKLHSNMTGSGKQLTSLQVKLHYLDITSQLPSYGAKCFSAGPKGDTMEKVILVSPKFGISQITGHRNSVFQPVPLANVEDMKKIEVRTNDEVTRLVFITLENDKMLEITLDEKDAIELVLILRGYFRLLTEQQLPVDQEKIAVNEDPAPPYVSQHKVMPEKWSYLEQGGIKTASFALQPTYRGINKKTNGLYNTVGRNSKPSMLTMVKYELDGNMNSAMANRNNRFAGNIDFGDLGKDANFKNIISNQLEGLYPFEKDDEYNPANRLAHPSEWQETSVDFDSDADEEAGKLKHSDSLTLLNKIHEKEDNFNRQGSELLKQLQSESDTDSLYTPHASPKLTKDDVARENLMSFGLRSPNTPDNHNGEFQGYLRRICDICENGTESGAFNSMLVFDPDIIDLTSLPPPITPDELDDGVPAAPLGVPPGPFADSTETLRMPDMNENQDLEEFLASVSVPPPVQKVTPATELTPEEIMAYIIPPPPVRSVDDVDNEAVAKNKSVLHDALRHEKENPGDDPGILRPLPRRSVIDEKPPGRPPKEFIKGRKDSSSRSPSDELLHMSDSPAPRLPPRSTGQPNEKSGKPQLPPKKPQLPLLASLNDSTSKESGSVADRIIKLSNAHEQGALKERAGAVSTPARSHVGPLAVYDKDSCELRASPNLDELLGKTESALKELLSRLKQASVKCLGRIANGDTSSLEKETQRTKEELTAQCLRLVSSSKRLVIAMSDSFLPDLYENLAVCLTILRRLTELCQQLVACTTDAPLQSRNLILNVRELVEHFRAFVTSPIDRTSPKAVEDHLASHAETLANILSTLLRNLKGFPS